MNKHITLCKPGRVPVCVLNGVDLNTVDYTQKFNDLDEITFVVDKYIEDSDGEKIISAGYDKLHSFMEIYVDEIGYFQIKEPEMSNEINKETKTVTGVSIATELLQKDLVGFTVNTSTAASLEMLADNNINSLGYPNEYITFYNPTNKQLSLLDLVLEKAVGWSVGAVDDFLKNQRYSFDNINENIFSFLTKTLSSTARCIFTFDTINKTVSAYSENHIGNDTGIVIAERNLLNSVNVQCDSDNIYTRINVQGKDSLNFADINYGDTHIFNLDYYSNLSYMNQDLIDALERWQAARDEGRDSYIDKVKTYQTYLEQISEMENKVPTNGVLNNWDNMSMDELNKNLTYYNSLIKELQIVAQNTHPKAGETEYVGNLDDYSPARLNPDGTVDHNSYMNDLDGQGKETYREIITYVIPNIEIAIENFDKTKDNKKDYFEDYLTDWSLYGLVELKAKKSSYENQINTLKKYEKEWDALTDEEKASHGNNSVTYTSYHNEYVKLNGYLSDIDSKTTELTSKKENIENNKDALSLELQNIREDMAITGSGFQGLVKEKWFTDEQIKTLTLLFHDTDYTNENILTTKLDNFEKKLEIEQELYNDAEKELAELSVPQYTLSCNLDNLLAMEEFSGWHSDFKVGNFITLEASSGVFTNLRLISISYNPFVKTNDLTVEFSNMITGKDGRNDFSYIFDKAISTAKNSITLSNNKAKDDLELSIELLNLLSNSTVFKGKFDEISYKNLSATEAQIKDLYANTGLITDLTVKDGKITGKLCAVEIDASNIKTGTLLTDRLLIKGNDSLYYKLNVTALGSAVVEKLPEEKQEELKNGIHGENIIAESITANKIAVSDLTAFKATIAAFKIEDLTDDEGNVVGGSFHSLLKDSISSSANGIYTDSNGQFVLGNDDEYIKFVKTSDGKFAFDIKTNVKINGNLLIDGSITADKIQANAITSDKIATGTITIGALDTSLKKSIDRIDNLAIGGRNILLGTSVMTIGTGGYAKSQWRMSGTGNLEQTNITDFSGIFNGIRLTITNATAQVGVVQDNVPLDKNAHYTLSFWARCVSGDSCTIVARNYNKSGDSDSTTLYTVASEWTRVVKVATNVTLSNGTFTAPVIALRPADVGTSVEICGIKLEKGTIATEWTPAPEDTTNQVLDNSIANWCYNNNKTYIDGAKIYTGTITADAIATKSITSGKIDVSELSAISVNLGTVKAGVIESNGYKKDTKGMKISLNDGTLDSKNFSIDAQGNVSIDGTIYATNGTLSNLLIVGSEGIACEYEMGAGSGSTKQTVRISEGKISFSNIYTSQDGASRTDTGTYIYQAASGIAFESESGEAYFKVSSMSSSALSHNKDSYVMINKQGLITANGSYLNSRDSNGNIVRLVALTTSNHFHIGSTDISGDTRVITGTGTIQFFKAGSTSGTLSEIMTFNSNGITSPSVNRIGVVYGETYYYGYVQKYSSSDKSVQIGHGVCKLSLVGTEITSNKSIVVGSDRRIKNHISTLPSGSENLFDYLDGKSFFYNSDTSTAKSYGFIAQEVLSALQKCGLTTDDFAGFCDINGDGSQYALAYEQFIPIMWEEIKRLRNQVKELKGE